MSESVPKAKLPIDLSYLDTFTVENVKFDITRAFRGLHFDYQGRMVTQNIAEASYKSVYGTEGWSEGVHYFEFKIVDGGRTQQLAIGVSDGGCSVTVAGFPGGGSDTGVCINASNGNRYFSNTNAPLGAAFGSGSIIGVLLNMQHRTCSFYMNGVRIGTAAGADVLRGTTYFPVVTLFELGQAVVANVLPISLSRTITRESAFDRNIDEHSPSLFRSSGDSTSAKKK